MFSVIIPTFNRSKTLAKALDSLTLQTEKSFEVIVADDGSTDDTPEVIKFFSEKLDLKYLWNPNWGGPARPRNIAANVAKREWLCFLDADDSFYPTKLSTIKNHPCLSDSDVIAHSLDIIGHDFKKNGIAFARDISLNNPFVDLMTNGNKFPNSATIIRRSIFEKIGGYAEDKNIIAVEDFDLLLRLSQVTNRFKALRTVLGAYNLGSDQISGTSEKYIESMKTVFSKYQRSLNAKDYKESKAIEHYLIASIYFKSSEKKKAREFFIKSLKSKRLVWEIKSMIRLMQTF